MNDKISVVVPAYNVGGYIGKCLESILAQTYKALEVIVINDGSTDNTENIILRYNKDPRIKYIRQKNAGAAAARNAGIQIATGKLLAFVDSDDYLEPNMYERLLCALTKSNADLAVCDYNLAYDGHIESKYSNMKDEKINISNGAADYYYKYCACRKPNNYIWTRMYRTDMIKNAGVRFQNFSLSEDTVFNFMLMPYLREIIHISDPLYNYYQRTSSIVYTKASEHNLAESYAAAFAYMFNYMKCNHFNVFLEVLPIYAYTRLRSIFFYSRLSGLKDEDIVKNIIAAFKSQIIAEYLRKTSCVDRYAALNGLSEDETLKIKEIMLTAADDPQKLNGMVIE